MAGKNEFNYWLDRVKGAGDEEIKERLLSIEDALNKSDDELKNAMDAFIEICKSKFPSRGGVPYQKDEELELNIEVRNSIKSQLNEILNK